MYALTSMDPRSKLSAILANIDQQLAEAEALSVAEGDDQTLQWASELRDELREMRRDVEEKLYDRP